MGTDTRKVPAVITSAGCSGKTTGSPPGCGHATFTSRRGDRSRLSHAFRRLHRLALFIILAGSLLLLGQPSVAAGSAPSTLPSPVVPDGLGLNVNYKALLQAPASILDLLCAAGFHTIRTDLDWRYVERTPGVYDFAGPGYDAFVQEMYRRGERTILILDYSNPLYDHDLSPYDDSGRQAFARFASAAVSHFHGMGVVWELYNEPDNHGYWRPTPDASAYAALVNAVVPAMRAMDPGSVIVGPALHANNPTTRLFYDPLGKAKALAKFDAISVHPYRTLPPETMIADDAALRQLLARYGVAVPILNSEVGYSLTSDVGTTWGTGALASIITPPRANPDTHRSLTANEQAAALVRTYLVGLSQGVNLTVWYDWRDDCSDPALTERQCHYGVLDRRLQPKAPLLAAQTLSTVLSGYHFVARLPVPSSHETALSFANGSAVAYALWSDIPGQTEALGLPLSGSWVLLDMFGTHSRVFRANGHSAIVLTGMPEYLLPLPSSPAATLGGVLASVTPSTRVLGSTTPTSDPTPSGLPTGVDGVAATVTATPRQTATTTPIALPTTASRVAS